MKGNLGFSLLEVILAVSLLSLFVVGFAGAWIYGEEATSLSGNRVRALLLAEEGLEAARNIRDSGFVNLSNGPHGLSTTSNQWNFSGASNVIGQFTRSITVSSIDPRRKAIASTVTWQQNQQRTGSVTLTTRLTEWARIVTSWVIPLRIAITNMSGVQNGVRVEVLGNFAYVIRVGAAQDFLIYNITNPAAPVLTGQLSLSGDAQNLFVSGSFAYVASTDNAQELQVINITNPAAPVLAGSYNDAGNDNATGVYVSGTTAYLTLDAGNEFVTVNVTNPAAPVGLGVLNLLGIPFEVVTLGSFAYLSTNNNTDELMVVNVSNPALPVLTTTLNLAGNTDGYSITGVGNTVYLGRSGAGGLAIISVATPSAPVLLGTAANTGDINDVALGNSNTYIFAATAQAALEFKIFNISTPSTPVLFGSFNNTGTSDGALTGVAYHAVQDRAYVVGAADVAELMVYSPQ